MGILEDEKIQNRHMLNSATKNGRFKKVVYNVSFSRTRMGLYVRLLY